MKNNRFLPLITVACILIFAQGLQGQCTYYRVNFQSGVQQIGCTTVSVAHEGDTAFGSYCCNSELGAYHIGGGINGLGSYTFTFSPAIQGVRINPCGITNNYLGNTAELAIDINGSFYPISNPGIPTNCGPPAIITPTGTIGAISGTSGAWYDVIIYEDITTLKLENVIIAGAGGAKFGLYICCIDCLTDAGTLPASPLNLCIGSTANLPPSNQPVLDNDDLLRYILYSNPDDVEGSIIATSSSPGFSFDPAKMQEGVTYYIAAIAGNGLNGNVDFDDPCFDMSNAVPVTWHPLPAVVFTVDNPDVCAGACTTVTISLTGTPPFTLSYTTPAGPVTRVFQSNTGTFQVCTAANAPSGSLVIQATALTDAWCTCE